MVKHYWGIFRKFSKNESCPDLLKIMLELLLGNESTALIITRTIGNRVSREWRASGLVFWIFFFFFRININWDISSTSHKNQSQIFKCEKAKWWSWLTRWGKLQNGQIDKLLVRWSQVRTWRDELNHLYVSLRVRVWWDHCDGTVSEELWKHTQWQNRVICVTVGGHTVSVYTWANTSRPAF